MKKWLVRNTDNALAMKLKTDTGLPMLLCSLLVGRGIYKNRVHEMRYIIVQER